MDTIKRPHDNILTEKVTIDGEMMRSNIGRNYIDPQNGGQPFSEVQAQVIKILRPHRDQLRYLKAISMGLPSHILPLQ